MEPKVYSLSEHQIAPDQIDTHAFYVIQKLKEAGHKAYLVGGGVRDLLLQQKPKDFDVSTSAKPEEIRGIFRNAILIGRRFRLAHVRFGRKVIEVSTFRSGDTETADLIVRDNEWGTEEQDVLRRDFTINGLFYDPESQEIIDYVDGYLDLEKRLLRTIGQPEARFIQDPVRMIRLIKFCARFQFEIDAPTFQALLNCKGDILNSSSARVFEELLRMLESGASRPFFHLLQEYGLLQPLLPNLAEALQEKEIAEPTFRLLEETDAEMKKQLGQPLDRALLLSVLLFPLFEIIIQHKSSRQPLHLGQIAELSHQLLDEVFSPFFQLPRRMRAILSLILTAQFRILPLESRGQKKLRAPRDPIFSMALHLFKWRAAVQPELLPTYTDWTEAMYQGAESPAPLPPRRRRRRRRRS